MVAPWYNSQPEEEEPDEPEFSEDEYSVKFNRFYSLKSTAIRKMHLNDSALFALIGKRRTSKSTLSIILLHAIDPDPT